MDEEKKLQEIKESLEKVAEEIVCLHETIRRLREELERHKHGRPTNGR
jgi:hypothetical protein